jgi:hypothetical protein
MPSLLSCSTRVRSWRVDDDGIFDPESFSVLFVVQNAETHEIELGIEWLPVSLPDVSSKRRSLGDGPQAATRSRTGRKVTRPG